MDRGKSQRGRSLLRVFPEVDPDTIGQVNPSESKGIVITYCRIDCHKASVIDLDP